MPKTTAANTKKHRSPSRARYEAAHRTVSFRITEDLQGPVENAKASGHSYADILRAGLGILQSPDLEAVGRDKYWEGWADGHNEAFEAAAEGEKNLLERVAITIHCAGCSQVMRVHGPLAMQAAREFFERGRWGHPGCH